jgi:hypothetical protein
MKADSTYVRALLFVLALATLAAFVFLNPDRKQRDLWIPSSFNAGPSGHKAIYATFQHLGWPVARWQEDYNRLSGQNQAMILARDPGRRRVPSREDEIRKLLAWVEKGNTLILCGNFAAWDDTWLLMKEAGFHPTPPDPRPKRFLNESAGLFTSPRPGLLLEPTAHEPDFAGQTLQLSLSDPLPPGGPELRILWEHDRSPYVAAFSRGKGRIVAIASSSFLDHQRLKESANLPYLLSLVAPSGRPPHKLWFEEAHHGFRFGYSIGDLFTQHGLQVAGWQVALGVAVFLVSQFYRFGPVLPFVREKNRSTMEFVRSMALLYRRSNLRDEILRDLFIQTQRRILHKFHLAPRTSHDQISAHLQRAFPHLPSWKKLALRLDSNHYPFGLPPKGWLKIARQLITIKREML